MVQKLLSSLALTATDAMAALDSKFRVRGVKRLRVLDASILLNPPGFFTVSSIYIAAEKAADVTHRDARSTT